MSFGTVFTALSDGLIWQARLGVRAFTRSFGWFGWALLLTLVVDAGAWFLERGWNQRFQRLLDESQASLLRGAEPITVDDSNGDSQARLKAFENHLLMHEDIPRVVKGLLDLADEEQLSITTGEYRPQIDEKGAFLRYQMTLPVKGDPHAIYRFIQGALRNEKTLALEGAQFKREQIQSSEIEARIRWAVLTRLPNDGPASMAVASVATEEPR